MTSATPVLGVDLGTVRVGLAMAVGRAAVPVDALGVGDIRDDGRWVEHVAERIAAAAAERGCDRIVLGLPRGLSGRDTRATQRARQVATAVERYGRTVVLFDERLTSVQADRVLAQVGRSERQRRTEVDSVAASVILQAWLDTVAAEDRAGGHDSSA